MKPAYVAILAIFAFFAGSISGNGRGQSSADDSWRRAVLSVPSESCRDAVRDALRNGE